MRPILTRGAGHWPQRGRRVVAVDPPGACRPKRLAGRPATGTRSSATSPCRNQCAPTSNLQSVRRNNTDTESWSTRRSRPNATNDMPRMRSLTRFTSASSVAGLPDGWRASTCLLASIAQRYSPHSHGRCVELRFAAELVSGHTLATRARSVSSNRLRRQHQHSAQSSLCRVRLPPSPIAPGVIFPISRTRACLFETDVCTGSRSARRLCRSSDGGRSAGLLRVEEQRSLHSRPR
jgi:hypothetical protein